MPRYINITGEKYGKLTAIERIGRHKYGGALWLFKCDCGKDRIADSSSVRTGRILSCGCAAREASVKNWKIFCDAANSARLTHGLSGKRVYDIWRSMVSRCHNPKNIGWKNYGSRGITVCDEWRNDPKVFAEWALSNGYHDDLSIDRISNNMGYSPNNCRWISSKEQCNNRRSNRLVTIGDETKTVQQWAEQFNIDKTTLRYRLNHGWDTTKALSTKVSHGNVNVST